MTFKLDKVTPNTYADVQGKGILFAMMRGPVTAGFIHFTPDLDRTIVHFDPEADYPTGIEIQQISEFFSKKGWLHYINNETVTQGNEQ